MELQKNHFKIAVFILFAAVALIFFAFDQPLTLIADNFVILPIAFVAASLANATAVGAVSYLFLCLFLDMGLVH